MKYLAYLFSLSLLLSACGGGGSSESSNGSDSTQTDEMTANTPEAPPTEFQRDPTATSEDFAYSVAGSAFPDDDLGFVAEWPLEGKDLPIIFFNLQYSPAWHVLIPNAADNFEYTLQEVALPDDSPWMRHQNTAAVEIYRTGLEPVDEAGGEDFVVSTELSGVMPAEDGMAMMKFIKAAVLRYKNGEVKYMPKLSVGYNGYIGATEEDVNLSTMEIATIKYPNLNGEVLDTPPAKEIAALLVDLRLAPNEEFGGNNELNWVSPTVEDTYVRANSDETHYFVISRDHSFPELSEFPSSWYPVYYITSEYDTYYFRVVAADVEGEEIIFRLVELDHTFEPTGETTVLSVVEENDALLVSLESGATLMRNEDAAQLEQSEDY